MDDLRQGGSQPAGLRATFGSRRKPMVYAPSPKKELHLMELKLQLGSSSKSMFGSSEVPVPTGRRAYSSSVSCFRNILCVRSYPYEQLCYSCRGFPVKCSYSRTLNSTYISNGSVSSSKFIPESYRYHINGTNGASSSAYTREPRVLDACDDEYGGVVVNADNLPPKPNAFASALRSSLSHWRMMGKKGVWLKLPVELSELIPIAVKEGFEYHHAERGYLMLTYWIPEGPCLLQANASHQIGVGGFVLNDNNEVLVVQERFCTHTFAGMWKLPTGFIIEAEEIYEGAVREVKEETGIDSEFVEVIAFRHAHNVAFEKSDLFFICMLRPVSTQIMVDDYEIQAAKWMPLVEFLEQPLIQSDRMFKKIMDICIERLDKRYCGLHPHHVISKFDGKESTLYYNVVDAKESTCEVNPSS